MPFDSNGTFNRVIPGGWMADAAANIKIKADRHDAEDDGFATGLSTCITKDGRTQPTANIPFNNKRLIAVGEPTSPSDAATKNYVDNFKSFTTGADISGAGPINGFISFTSPTGVNGIGWATADMSWVGKLEEALKTSKRLCVNDKADGTGTDVAIVDETGRLNNLGWLTSNLSWDGTAWRTIALGTGTALNYSGGSFGLSSNDAATTVDYQVATLREFFKVKNTDGTVNLDLFKTASAKTVEITSYMAANPRWKMAMGNATAESGTRKGSDFVLTSYANDGTSPVNIMTADRELSKVTFAGAVYSSQQFNSSSTTAILSAANGGAIYFRPNGPTSTVEQMILNTTGDLSISNDLTVGTVAHASYGTYAGAGIREKGGSSGGYGDSWVNFNGTGSSMGVYHGATYLGLITWQCDYRLKKNVKALLSTWDKVKSLRPVSYQQKKWNGFEPEDDKVRWGFLAHELQEKLVEGAVNGEKDAENALQTPNPWVMLAALTRALQEAMARIEALEAGA